MQKTKIINDVQFDQAYLITSRIIRDYGEKYLPLFKRLYDEKQSRNEKRDLTNVALQAAESALN